MAARFIIDNRTGALYEDFTARRKVSATDVLLTERGLTTEVQVYSLTVPTDGTAPTTATLTNADLTLDISRADKPNWTGELAPTYGGSTAAKVSTAAPPAALQAALNSLSASQDDGGFTVRAAASGWIITAKAFGTATSTPGLNVEDIQPAAVVSATTIQAGDADTRAQWALDLHPVLVADVDGGEWASVTDGSYSGLGANLALNTTSLIAALRDGAPFEIAINHSGERLFRGAVQIDQDLDPSGSGSPPVIVYARLVNGDALSTPRAPTVNDDVDLGYAVGSVWIYNTETYFLVDNTADAADWNPTSVATGAWSVEASFPSTSGVAGTASEMAVSANQIAVYNGSAWVYFEGFSKT